MHMMLWVLLAAVVFANETQERRSKLPYVADALGNTLPPPSNLPATVGSPVNLLTPDRYEFYTFDESGELVKRLMTLEEIQAIVAAGEETEGLVTFANDNQPTIAFNFSQPPYTKVHSVVTNVQNVLKAQMEAQKNKPHMQPTLDTPDVSDSWSLILPSIFGNTGVDIIPDKTTGSYITPETETIELDRPGFDEESLSKEGGGHIFTSSTDAPLDNKIDFTKTTVASTTTRKTTTSTTTSRPTSTRRSTTTKVTSTTSIKPKTTTTTTTTEKPSASVTKPTLTYSTEVTYKQRPTYSTTIKSTAAPSSTTTAGFATSKVPSIAVINPETSAGLTDQLQTVSKYVTTTERGDIQYERVSTFIPVSTITYSSERTTEIPLDTTKEVSTQFTSNTKNIITSVLNLSTTSTPDILTKITTITPKDTSESIFLSNDQEVEKNNATTITTQSVSPSTSVSYTQSTPIENSITNVSIKENQANIDKNDSVPIKDNEPIIPLFDVAQSISQIASDLGGAYRPITTSNNLLENKNPIDLESKENLDIDIPSDTENINELKTDGSNNTDNYIKISTLDPHDKIVNITSSAEINTHENADNINSQTIIPPLINIATTLDPVLSESMGDLLSQVVNESPDNNFNDENVLENEEKSSTIEFLTMVTTEYEEVEVTTEVYGKNKEILTSNDVSSESGLIQIKNKNKINEKIPIELMDIPDKKENFTKVPTINTAVSDDKSTVIISVTDITPDIRNGTQQVSSESENVFKLNTENTKSNNSTLPSYKSETDHLPGIKANDTKTNNDFLQPDLMEEKGLLEVNQKELEQELMPKVEEFKKKIQKVNIDDKELGSDRNNSWKLIPTVSPSKAHEITKFNKDKSKTDANNSPDSNNDKNIILDFSTENQGLELTTKDLEEDISQFAELCNELAFRYWNDMIETIDQKRSFVFSPYAITSMLAMMFMGARGATSGEMNDILKLDDMVTFNPHFTLKNISDSIDSNPSAGVAVSAFIRELYSDRNKGKILTFYKERAQHFYNGHVEEVNFKLISDIIRRRTNLLVKRYTWGKISEYMKTNTIVMQPPLAAFSANIFQTDCTGTSVDGRDGELYFVVSPNVRQRRLVPVPAVVYKNNFLAGYDPVLDATAAALGSTISIVSTLFVMPGQQGNIVHAEDLEDLEKRLLGSNPTTPAWNRLLRTLLPRVGLELQIPRFSHKSTFNISSTLQRMGLKDLFDADHADLGGLNGPSKDLYLSDMIQSNTFATCGENMIGEQHHVEQYPELQKRRSARWVNDWNEPRDYQRAFHDPHDGGEAMHLPLHLRPRQARLPARNAQPARLKFDRPFLFFVRHNPSGMILYVGRYNPRLLP